MASTNTETEQPLGHTFGFLLTWFFGSSALFLLFVILTPRLFPDADYSDTIEAAGFLAYPLVWFLLSRFVEAPPIERAFGKRRQDEDEQSPDGQD